MTEDYAKLAYHSRQHFLRYQKRVESMAHKLICQECGGGGGWVVTSARLRPRSV